MDPLKNLIYIYQSEHYFKNRFLHFVYKHINWFTLNKRGDIDWTIRSRLIYIMVLLIIVSTTLVLFNIKMFYIPLFLLVVFIFLPLMIIFVDMILSPIILIRKSKLKSEAKKIMLNLKQNGLIVCGITGSYGKTTTKDALTTILAVKNNVIKTPGNINTDIGIAKFILNHKRELSVADIFIVEMSAYKKGEITAACNIVSPDYSITTALGPVHIDRFGSMKKIIFAKFELANNTLRKSFLNVCNKIIQENYKKLIVSTNSVTTPVCDSGKITYLDNFAGIKFTIKDNSYKTKLVNPYIIEILSPIIYLAKELGLTTSEIKDGIIKLDYIKHRLEIIRNDDAGRIIIDDTYNGNYAGFIAGLNLLSTTARRRVVLTPGIVELGSMSVEIHKNLAKKYIELVDLVLLIKNKNTDVIQRYFDDNGFSEYIMYKDARSAHNDLQNVLKYNDVILFQNDLTDNY